jgi:hypothetical protein
MITSTKKQKEISMLKRILPVMLAVAIMISGGAVFAADAAAPAAKAKAHGPTLTKQQVKDIKMACKKDHTGDKAAIKACVKEKEDAAKADAVKSAAPADAPAQPDTNK